MTHKRSILLFALLITFSLACAFSGGASSKKNPPSASKNAADLRITDQQEVSGASVLSISPDGEWYLAQGDGEICYGKARTLAQTGCAAFRSGIDGAGIAWSPDSTQAAFTENAYIYMLESDLWVLNIKTGNLTNLTNDNYDGSLLKAKDTAVKNGDKLPVDTLPAWSPDGKSIVFVRSSFTDSASTSIYRIPAKGGTPVELLTVNPDRPFEVYRGPRWTGDGKKFVYTVMSPGSGERDNGIWIADQDGKNPKLLLGESQDWGVPILTDVSAAGDKALVLYYKAMQVMSKPNQSFILVLDLKTGDTTPLKETAGDTPEYISPTDAVFSPDGSKIVYCYRSLKDNAGVLAVRSVGASTEVVLIDQTDWVLNFQMTRNLHALYWTVQDTLFVKTNPDGGLWLTIGSK